MSTTPGRGRFRLCVALALGATGVGCGGSRGGFVGSDSAPGATRDGGARAPSSRDGGTGDVGSLIGGEAGLPTLRITPANPTLTVSMPGQTLAFKLSAGTATEAAVWSLNAPELGSIDSNGLFMASGLIGGRTAVTAQDGANMATTTLTVKLSMTANPAMLTAATQQMLEAGGGAPVDATTGLAQDASVPPLDGGLDAGAADQIIANSGFRWLYPYDGTVFPRGLAEPLFQFSGPAADFVYVHITFATLDYKGFFNGVATGQVDIGAAAWQTITSSAGATDSVGVELTKIASGVVTGPITEHWTIAQGSLKGTVYYNSYDSQLFGADGTGNGGILKLKPGSQAAPLIGGANPVDCTVCHAVSSDGSTLIASHPGMLGYDEGTAYDLKNNATPIWQQTSGQFSFGGIYPDGTFAMTEGFTSYANTEYDLPGTLGYDGGSHIIATNGGTAIQAPGWDGVVTTAITPSFSPDGTKIGFTHYDVDQANHTIGVMDFDLTTHSFSNLVDLAIDPYHYLGWPTFTPDNEWVVFHADTNPDLSSWDGHDANLVIAHMASHTVANLDVLNGFKNGVSYVPYGLDDLNHNYMPTVLPVAVGGYYWVVFTSRRNYGNTFEGMNPWFDADGNQASPRKKLWVAALDLDAVGHPSASAHDISHPAFYLDGQELAAGNSRGFWALDPCVASGGSCQTGDECCTGFCRGGAAVDGGVADSGALTCVVVPSGGCSDEYEKCTISANCCGAIDGYICINAHCAAPAPPK